LVTFTQEVDASLINETTITLERIAGEGAERISIAAALAEQNPAVLLITPHTVLESGIYRVTVRGTGGGAVANLNAITLGSDTSFEFIVEPAP
jgi:hypothetical protein